MHVGCINENKELDSKMFKVHNHVCKYAILLRISLKCPRKDRSIGLLRHAYQQDGVLR